MSLKRLSNKSQQIAFLAVPSSPSQAYVPLESTNESDECCSRGECISKDWSRLVQFFPRYCAEHFLANPIAIGGPGKVVEINESKFGEYLHRKITMFVSICVCMWMGTGCLEG